MGRILFLISGNICGDRVRLGRALQKPPITQEELARRIQFMGYENMTKRIISQIERNQRHVCDAELLLLWNGSAEKAAICDQEYANISLTRGHNNGIISVYRTERYAIMKAR